MYRLFAPLRYFLFMFLRFNPVLACLIIYDEVKGERKYHLQTTGVKNISKLNLNNTNAQYSHDYMPSNYILLQQLFEKVNTYAHNHTFLDIGCGKGRTLFVAAHFGFTNITGIELYPPYCHFVEKEMKRYAAHSTATFNIVCTDAANFSIPTHIQTILLYNPFAENIMMAVLNNILTSYHTNNRDVFIMYLCPIQKEKFIEAGFTEVHHITRFNYLNASLLYLKKQAFSI